MSVVAPFRGIRYNQERYPDLSALLAPPYDVLSAADKDDLLLRDAHNFVAIDLPHVPPKHAGPAEAYAGAARRLSEWRSFGTLVADAQPCIYPYHQRFTHAGRTLTRKMFLARLRLEAFGAGMVFPHEQTFGGPKEDRLLLTKATAANLSPIFGLYPDAPNTVSARLDTALPEKPVGRGTLDGVENTMWAVSDAATVADLASLMADKPVFIADGHHRYGTAMMYRDWLRSEQGELPPDHPANFVLCAFGAMEDPGMLILPTHRVLPGLRPSEALVKGDGEIEFTPLSARTVADALGELPKCGPQAVAYYADHRYAAIRPRRAELLDASEPNHSLAWRRLALAFLHAHLLPKTIAQASGERLPEIIYVKSAEETVSTAEKTGGCAFLMQPTTMQELRDVCAAGDLMPQKSTFFFPKIASGMVIHSLQ